MRFAHVHERVSTKSFVVLIGGNSTSFHLGVQSTLNDEEGAAPTLRASMGRCQLRGVLIICFPNPASHADFGAATHPGVGGGTADRC